MYSAYPCSSAYECHHPALLWLNASCPGGVHLVQFQQAVDSLPGLWSKILIRNVSHRHVSAVEPGLNRQRYQEQNESGSRRKDFAHVEISHLS
jgi:hypothetical protein